jgi:hypothetical protein
MSWSIFDEGKSIGTLGSERGVILRDQEHSAGARITLERDTPQVPYTITCGIYGWMVHTRFFGTEQEAQAGFDLMSLELARIIVMIPLASDPDGDSKMRPVSDAISKFVEKFP